MNGLTYSTCNSGVIDFIKITNNIAQNYFPEVLFKMFIINAPSIFTIMWAGIKKFLDENTQKKIFILGA